MHNCLAALLMSGHISIVACIFYWEPMCVATTLASNETGVATTRACLVLVSLVHPQNFDMGHGIVMQGTDIIPEFENSGFSGCIVMHSANNTVRRVSQAERQAHSKTRRCAVVILKFNRTYINMPKA